MSKRQSRLRDMRPRQLRELVKHLEECLASYDTDPAVQAVILRRRRRRPSKTENRTLSSPPPNCPNCEGQREWTGPGVATCYFCGDFRGEEARG